MEKWLELMDIRQKAIIINTKDNVATALADLKAGDSVELEIHGKMQSIRLTDDIPFGHKFSLFQIERGSPVIKYGEVIGVSTIAVKPGDYVHIHNVASARGRGDLAGGI